jgi:Raf kinase inhibitor-like YbhB/YbcL family protein
MQLFSPVFKSNQSIPSKYAKDGVSPPLQIQDIPSQTKSLVLIVHDPDAPNMDFVHWLIWDIPPKTKEIPEGQIPSGATQGINDTGGIGWFGPAPPSGTHRYFFELYALDTNIGLPQDTPRDRLLTTIEPYIKSQATLIGTYSA